MLRVPSLSPTPKSSPQTPAPSPPPPPPSAYCAGGVCAFARAADVRTVLPSQTLPGVQRGSQRCTAWVQFEGRSFLAYGCGPALVVVDGTLRVLQCSQLESRVNSVHFSVKDAKLAASHGRRVSVFAPVCGALSEDPSWAHLFDVEETFPVTAVRWMESFYEQQLQQQHNPSHSSSSTSAAAAGVSTSSLVVAGTSMCVYEWEAPPARLAMRRDLGRPVSALSCSPDARFVATLGTTDCLVKVWFRRPEQPVCYAANGTVLCKHEECDEDERGCFETPGGEVSADAFSFLYLRHPATVLHVSWRPAREGPRSPNVLLTTAVDSVVRLWTEQHEPDAMPTPVPSYDTPRFNLVCTVPARPGSLVEWVRTLQPFSGSVEDLDRAQLAEEKRSQAAGGRKKKKEKVKLRYRHEYDSASESEPESEDDQRHARSGPTSSPRDQWLYHAGAACPLAEKFTPAARKTISTDPDWLAEFDRYGTVVLWKFRNTPLQMPSVSVWAKTQLSGPSGSSLNTKTIVPISFAFADSSPRSSPTALWMYVFNSAGTISWWTLTRTTTTLPILLQAELHSQLFGHRGVISRFVPHPTLAWGASISTVNNVILWNCDDTKPFEHPHLLRDVCKLGQYSLLAWVPAGNLFMVSVGNAIFVYALDDPEQMLQPQQDASPQQEPRSQVQTPAPSVMPYFMMGMLEQSEALDRVTFLDSIPGKLLGSDGEDESAYSSSWIAVAVAEGGRRLLLWECSVEYSEFSSHCLLSRSFVSGELERISAACVMGTSPARDAVCEAHFRAALFTGHDDGTARLWTLEVLVSEDGTRTYDISELTRITAHEGPITSISSPYFGRLATWSAPSSDIRLWQMESAKDLEFRFEASFPFPQTRSNPLAASISAAAGSGEEEFGAHFDFFPLCDGSDVFALGIGKKVRIFSQRSELSDSHALSSSWTEVANTLDLESPCTALSWTFNGTLVIATGQHLQAFSRFAVAVSQNEPQASFQVEQGLGSTLFHVALAAHHAVPIYHPRILEEYTRSGELGKTELVLRKLLEYLEFLEDPASSLSSLFPLSPHEFLWANPDLSPAPTTAPDQPAAAGTEDVWDSISFEAAPRRAASQWLETEEGERLVELLKKVQLPEISATEQQRLLALVGVVHDVIASASTLDPAGARFFTAFKLFVAYKAAGLEHRMHSSDFLWAVLSDSHDALLKLCLPGDVDWEMARDAGVGFWVSNPTAVRDLAERIAKTHFSRDRNPADCAAFYLAMGKKSVLLSLYKYVKEQKVSRFLTNDFTNPKWIAAAAKNAFVLEGQRKFLYAVAFFLLANQLDDALQVCTAKLKDPQLALFLAKLVEPTVVADGLTHPGPCAEKLLRKKVLEPASAENDVCLCSLAHWVLRDFDSALRDLALATETVPLGAPFDTSIFRIHLFMKGHVMMRNAPLELRTTTPLAKRTLYGFVKAGCSEPALDLLRQLPEMRLAEYALADEERRVSVAAPAPVPVAPNVEEEFDEFGGSLHPESGDWFDDFVSEPSPPPSTKEGAQETAAVEDSSQTAEVDTATSLRRSVVEKVENALADVMRFSVAMRSIVRQLLRSNTDTASSAAAVLAWTAATGLPQDLLVQATLEFCEVYGYFAHESAIAKLSLRPQDSFQALVDLMASYASHICALPAFMVASTIPESVTRNLEAVARQLYPSLQVVKPLMDAAVRRKIEFSIFFGMFISWWKRKEWRAVRDLLGFDIDAVLPYAVKMSKNGGPLSSVQCVSLSAGMMDVNEPRRAEDDEGDDEDDAKSANGDDDDERGSAALPPSAEDLRANAEICGFAESLLGLVAMRVALMRLESFFAKPPPEVSWHSSASFLVPPAEFLGITRALDQWVALQEQRLSLSAPGPETVHSEPGKLSKTLMKRVKKTSVVRSNKAFWDFLRLHFAPSYRASKDRVLGRIQKAVPEGAERSLDFGTTKLRSSEISGILSFCVSSESRYLAVASSKGGIKEIDLTPRAYESEESISPAEPSGQFRRTTSTVPLVVSPSPQPVSPFPHPDDGRALSQTPDPGGDDGGHHLAVPQPRNPIAAIFKRSATHASVASVASSQAATPAPHSIAAKLCHRPGIATTMDAHPVYPYYITAGPDGRIALWQFLVQSQLSSFSFGTHPAAPVAKVRFSPTGMRFGAVDKSGAFALWGFTAADISTVPFYRVHAHSKSASDLVFLNSATFVATCGSSASGSVRQNVCLWDTLLPAQTALVASCGEIEIATSIEYSPRHQLVLVGDTRGAIHSLDVRKFGSIVQTAREHTGAVNDLALGPRQEFLFSASADGAVKCWSLPLALVHTLGSEVPRKLTRSVTAMVFRDSGFAGISQVKVIERDSSLAVFTAGQDGRLQEYTAAYSI